MAVFSAPNIGIFRAGTWYLDIDGDGAFGGPTDQTFTFTAGAPGEIAVAGDWDGDGDDNVGVYYYDATWARGVWYLDSQSGFVGDLCASAIDVPVVGDWDGDGDDNVGLYRYSGGYGLWLQEFDNYHSPWCVYDREIVFGTASNQKPVVGDWDGDGDDNIGLFRYGTFQLVTSDAAATSTRWVYFGSTTYNFYTPLAGNWDGAGGQKPYRESYVYDGTNILLEFLDPDAAGPQPSALRSRLLHGPAVDQLLADEQFLSTLNPPPSTTYWPLFDWLGSTRDLVDSSGSVQKHIDYDSFGNVGRVTNGSGQPSTLDSQPSTPFLYTGREFDKETGLQYNRARYFDAAIGRFISEDPIGFGGGDANLYRYVGNSPTNLIDPSGLQDRRGPTTMDDPKKHEPKPPKGDPDKWIDDLFAFMMEKWRKEQEEKKRPKPFVPPLDDGPAFRPALTPEELEAREIRREAMRDKDAESAAFWAWFWCEHFNNCVGMLAPVGGVNPLEPNKPQRGRPLVLEPMKPKMDAAATRTEAIVGKNPTVFRNEAGDLILQSKDGLREIRFDFNHTHPHKHPHVHVIVYKIEKNKKVEVINKRFWPCDVSPE